jgi:hypothetical protein
VLTVDQVYELAERVGMRPVGNIRATPDGYRLRFARHGVMQTSAERHPTRAGAEQALWKMAADGRADSVHDQRFRALVLLATFASLRWGHDSERAAMIYQHEARGADKAITDAIDKHVDDERGPRRRGGRRPGRGARARLMARRPVRAVRR